MKKHINEKGNDREMYGANKIPVIRKSERHIGDYEKSAVRKVWRQKTIAGRISTSKTRHNYYYVIIKKLHH